MSLKVKYWIIVISIISVFLLVSNMDFEAQCRTDKQCAEKYLSK